MKRFVLDASVGLAWVVDRNTDPYARLVQQSLESGALAVVPVFWQLEIANVLAMVEKRGLLSRQEVEEGLRYYERFLATAELIVPLPTLRESLQLARELHLTSYDALYIYLAQQQGLPLATLDKSLRIAATKAGLELFRG